MARHEVAAGRGGVAHPGDPAVQRRGGSRRPASRRGRWPAPARRLGRGARPRLGHGRDVPGHLANKLALGGRADQLADPGPPVPAQHPQRPRPADRVVDVVRVEPPALVRIAGRGQDRVGSEQDRAADLRGSGGRPGTAAPDRAPDRSGRGPGGRARGGVASTPRGTARCAARPAHLKRSPAGRPAGPRTRSPGRPRCETRRLSSTVAWWPFDCTRATPAPVRISPPAAVISPANARATAAKSAIAVSGECSPATPRTFGSIS